MKPTQGRVRRRRVKCKKEESKIGHTSKNAKEITESKNLDKNDEMNMENKENMDIGDFSSNLDGYSSKKGESRKAKAKESNEKNIASKNIGEEDKN